DAGAFAIYRHVHGWIIECLAELHVAQRGNVLEPVFYFLCELAIGRQVRAADRHFNGRGRAKTHHSTHDVTRLKREAYVRHIGSELFTQAFLERFDSDRRAGLQLHLNHAFLRTAVPEVNQVDGITRRVNADEAQSDFHILRAD